MIKGRLVKGIGGFYYVDINGEVLSARLEEY